MANKYEKGDYIESVIGASVRIEGDLISDGDLQIEGQVNGKVNTSRNLRVGESARIQADVLAENALIAGTVEGNIKVTDTLIILETGRVLGNVFCQKFGMREGAYFSGQCNMEQPAKTRHIKAETEVVEE